MRKLLCWNLVICALLCLPALALRQDDKQALRELLSRTVNSLATFKDFDRRVEARDADVVTELIAASEAGPSDVTLAEAELVALRTRVNALQEILDSRAAWSGALAAAPGVDPKKTGPETQTEGTAVNAAAPVSQSTAQADVPASNKKSFEAENFIADRARLGRACWRGGRYLEGVAALEALAGEPQADYWRARCLEKLSRHSEALALYRKVIEIAGDSPEGKSAREDLEFLEWSISHKLVNSK